MCRRRPLVVGRTVRAGGRDEHETIRVGVRRGRHQDPLDEAEHRSRGADTQAERQNGDDREAWVLDELAQTRSGCP